MSEDRDEVESKVVLPAGMELVVPPRPSNWTERPERGRGPQCGAAEPATSRGGSPQGDVRRAPRA